MTGGRVLDISLTVVTKGGGCYYQTITKLLFIVGRSSFQYSNQASS